MEDWNRSETSFITVLGNEKVNHHYESLSRKIIGAVINVHKELGSGFIENIWIGFVVIDQTHIDI